MKLVMPRGGVQKISELAKKSPVEVCGFLVGRKEGDSVVVEEIRETRNRLNSPVEFEIDPLEIVEVLDEAEEKGLEVVGIFHSHIKCPPVPSEKDLKGMNMWRNVWLIVTPSGEFQAWILENGGNRGSRCRSSLVPSKDLPELIVFWPWKRPFFTTNHGYSFFIPQELTDDGRVYPL
jgi:proteasome lid subunit RPN8/RPN11